jgi:hypothetical protein
MSGRRQLGGAFINEQSRHVGAQNAFEISSRRGLLWSKLLPVSEEP